MTDAREIADKYTGLYLSGATDKYIYLSDAIYDAVMEAAESHLAALAAKDAESQEYAQTASVLASALDKADTQIQQQAAEIERLNKSACEYDNNLFIAEKDIQIKQMRIDEMQKQIEHLQARVKELEQADIDRDRTSRETCVLIDKAIEELENMTVDQLEEVLKNLGHTPIRKSINHPEAE